MSRSILKISFILLLVSLTACTSAPKKDLALERVRDELNDLKANAELAGYAPLALGEAERALRTAEQATGKDYYKGYLVYMADRRIQIAKAMAEREQQSQVLREQQKIQSNMLIKSSQLEASQARLEAERARMLVATTNEEAERAREEKDQALQEQAESARQAELAEEEAQQARKLAESRASEADFARREADLASQQITSLTRQLENLQLRQTESGVVVTLGDVLFKSGETNLAEGAQSSLVEVVDLLQTEPSKKIRVEGHTDSSGDAATNSGLSQQRADSVREALINLGIEGDRITAIGMGQEFPIASNADEAGRARNRRVDVILLDN
jgi:outer membrane protein OmpA-like peptidoglycan-associated protein